MFVKLSNRTFTGYFGIYIIFHRKIRALITSFLHTKAEIDSWLNLHLSAKPLVVGSSKQTSLHFFAIYDKCIIAYILNLEIMTFFNLLKIYNNLKHYCFQLYGNTFTKVAPTMSLICLKLLTVVNHEIMRFVYN